MFVRSLVGALQDRGTAPVGAASPVAPSDDAITLWNRRTLLHQSGEQLQKDIASVKSAVENLLRQFQDLAFRRRLSYIDPVDHRNMPHADESETRKAASYRIGKISAGVLGIITFLLVVGVSVQVASWSSFFALLFGCLTAAFFLGHLGMRIAETLVDPDWRDADRRPAPDAPSPVKRRMRRATIFFGILATLSVIWLAWARLSASAAVLDYFGLPLALFELSLLGLLGVFHCGETFYRWSKDLSDKIHALQDQIREYEVRHAELQVEITALQYRLEELKEDEELKEETDDLAKIPTSPPARRIAEKEKIEGAAR
jgi:hypothetical protein